MWHKHSEGIPLEYHFVDELIDEQYQFEKRLAQLFNSFTGLAIFISCLGLFGLTTFVAERRTKEIGVRKVLGASILNIFRLLSTEFVKWVLLANIITWPVAWLAMQRWLQDYPYRTEITVWIFPLAGLVALGIALITVSYLVVRAARANPVVSLRYE